MAFDSTINDLLTGSGVPTAKFATIGDVHKGRIVGAKRRQQTEMGSGKPLTFDNGDPKWELLIDLATDERDATLEDDDGTRRVYAKGQMLKAIGEACRKAGANGIDEGGLLAVQYYGDGQASKPGFNPPKLFVAQYKPPSVDAGADLFGTPSLGQQLTAAAAPQPAPSDLF